MKTAQLSHHSSQRQINEESLRRRRKLEEDLKTKKRELREEFRNLEESNCLSQSLMALSSVNEFKLKAELNSLSLENNRKYEVLANLNQTPQKHSVYSRSLSLNTTTQRDRIIDHLTQKLEKIDEILEGFDRKLACAQADRESLLQKRAELQIAILDYKKKNESLGYLNQLANRKFSNVEAVDFKARESKKSSEHSLNLIRGQLYEIKGLEKSFMSRKVELAKEGKTSLGKEEEQAGKTQLALDEARAKNQTLLQEIEKLRMNEETKREHTKNMRFLDENLRVLGKLKGYLNTGQLKADVDDDDENGVRRGLLDDSCSIIELADLLCSKYQEITIETDSLNTIYQDLNQQKNLKKTVLEDVTKELNDLRRKNSARSLDFQPIASYSSNSGLFPLEDPESHNPLTLNILQTDINGHSRLGSTLEKCARVVFFLDFFLLTSASKLLKILFLISSIVISIPTNLHRPLHSLLNDKFKGLFPPNEFPSGPSLLGKSMEGAGLRKVDSLNNFTPEKQPSDQRLFSFDKESFEMFMSSMDHRVSMVDLKSRLAELLNPSELDSLVMELQRDPLFGFLNHEGLERFMQKLRKANKEGKNLMEIARSSLEMTIFGDKCGEVERLFGGIGELIEMVGGFSKEIRRKLVEKDPYYMTFSSKAVKYQVNEYIARAFKKIGARIDAFYSEETSPEAIKDRERGSVFDKFLGIGEQPPNSQREEPVQKAQGETDFSAFIEKAHEEKLQKDPRIIYTEFRNKKNKGNMSSIGGKRGSVEGRRLLEKISEDDFFEREREKIKSLKTEKEREETLARTKNMKSGKSQSLHEASLDFSKGNQGVLRQFAKDYSVLSKIYRLEKKQDSTIAPPETLFTELLIQKKRKTLNFRKELMNPKDVHYQAKNQLYETRRTASQELRDNIQRSRIELPKAKPIFSKTFTISRNKPSPKPSHLMSLRPKIRARTSNAGFRMDILPEPPENPYEVLFERSEQDSVWDILRENSSSSFENWGKRNNLTPVLIPVINQ